MTNDRDNAAPIAQTASGAVRGVQGNGVATFHAIPYAAPPLGPSRFAAPAAVPKWADVRDCTTVGASPPQGPSRLDAVMGVAPFAQSEDCLTLTVWTPAADNAKRPVMIWLHGGAYQSGGAHQVFYAGGNLARAGDIVVVGVNYRLGALGYLHLPEAEAAGGVAANRGLLDQMQALRWVAGNIAAFGGDPGNVTICGQSAGGGSLLALLADPASRALVRRAISQSASMSTLSLERAGEINAAFYAAAGVTRGDIAALRAMPVAAIVAAQRKVQMDIAATGDRTIAYQNVSPTAPCPVNPAQVLVQGAAAGIPLLIGSTRDEGHAWLAQDDKLMAATRFDVVEPAAKAAGYWVDAADLPADRKAAATKPWEVLSAMMTWAVFEKPARRLADAHASHGGEAYVYRFDWQPAAGATYGACHCIEIPFVFDNLAGWPAAAMMAAADPAAVAEVTRMVQGAWISFIRDGKPTAPGLPEWPRWTVASRPAMMLDANARVLT